MNVQRFVRLHNNVKSANFPGVLYNTFVQQSNVRTASTCDVKSIQNNVGKDSWIKRTLRKVPFVSVDRTRLKVAGYMHYEGIADKINYFAFFEEFNLPDTFYSWFVVTELHIWMLSVRLMAEEDGKIIRRSLVEALWGDIAQRVRKLGAGTMKHQVFELHEQLQAAFIAYDEGLQSDDVVLAGALWRTFYQYNYADPAKIEKLVKYVRKQITLLDNLPREKIFHPKESIDWAPVPKG